MHRSPAHRPFRALRACVAWLVAALQVVGALHFALIPHTFSARLGGLAHVHGTARVTAEGQLDETRAARPRAPSLTVGSRACSVDSCPEANAPAGTPLAERPVATGTVNFGSVTLLGECAAPAALGRVLPNAPKTSPPA